MPLYILRCLNCKQEGEVLLPLDAPIPLCGKCQSGQEKVICAPAQIKIDNIPIKYKRLGGFGLPKSWEPSPGET